MRTLFLLLISLFLFSSCYVDEYQPTIYPKYDCSTYLIKDYWFDGRMYNYEVLDCVGQVRYIESYGYPCGYTPDAFINKIFHINCFK